MATKHSITVRLRRSFAQRTPSCSTRPRRSLAVDCVSRALWQRSGRPLDDGRTTSRDEHERLRRAPGSGVGAGAVWPCDHAGSDQAIPLAAGIFLDVLNIFLFFLQIFWRSN
jgi:hypothetical protein